MKVCNKCNVEKKDAAFSKNQNRCKECDKIYRKLAPPKIVKTTKICKTCGIEKPIELFVKNKLKCKECQSIYNKKYGAKYRIENKSHLQEKEKQYRQDHKKEIGERSKKYRVNNRENISIKNKQWSENNKEYRIEYNHNYHQREDVKIRRKERDKLRRDTDSAYKFRQYISNSVNDMLSTGGTSKKGKSILQYLKYSVKDLINWIISQFSLPVNLTPDGKVWMTLENQGKYIKYGQNAWDDNDPTTWKWQLDHIIPQSDLPYDSMDHPNFEIAWALSNLRPLSAKQNLLDGTRRIRHQKKKRNK